MEAGVLRVTQEQATVWSNRHTGDQDGSSREGIMARLGTLMCTHTPICPFPGAHSDPHLSFPGRSTSPEPRQGGVAAF